MDRDIGVHCLPRYLFELIAFSQFYTGNLYDNVMLANNGTVQSYVVASHLGLKFLL